MPDFFYMLIVGVVVMFSVSVPEDAALDSLTTLRFSGRQGEIH
jgi:hypothetical protein